MTKKESVKIIADRHGDFSRDEIEMILDEFIGIIEETLVSGNKFQITGFGTFDIKENAGREGRNPKTGDVVMIKPSKSPKFKASSTLKNIVNV